MKINVTFIPSDYEVVEWYHPSFPTNSLGSPLTKYYIFKPTIWEAL